MKTFFVFVTQVIMCIVFGYLAWQTWGLYKDEKAANIFASEVQMVKVQVSQVSNEKQSWRDYLANVKYIRFNYHGKSYGIRYVEDSLFVSEGTPVSLLYHTTLDAFRQPGQQLGIGTSLNSNSILLRWSVIGLFSTEHRWLVLCLMLAVFFFIFLTGLLQRIPGLAFVQYISGIVFSILFFILAIYLTYDAWKHHQYYNQVKAGGMQVQVPLLGKSEGSGFFEGRHTRTRNYEYSATVSYQGKERNIAISSTDYKDVKKGDSLTVYYNSQLDDMMSVRYSLRFYTYVFPVIVWLILLWVLGKRLTKRKKQQLQ